MSPVLQWGVLWKSRIPKWGSVPVFSAFCMIRFAMSTKCSAFVLDCVEEGEPVAWSNSVNFLNSRDINCGSLSLLSWCGIPCHAICHSSFSITSLDVWVSSLSTSKSWTYSRELQGILYLGTETDQLQLTAKASMVLDAGLLVLTVVPADICCRDRKSVV